MIRYKLTAAAITLSAMGLTTACAAVGASYAGTGSGEACEIQAFHEGNGTTLTGTFHSEAPVSGTYSFKVTGRGSSGSSNISQGGEFEAAQGEDVELGNVMMSSPGGIFDAVLEVTIDGRTVDCRKRVGAI